ncbi:MAG: TIGR01777 family oxidoreductase [Myxococcales bacterium]
MATIAVTGASGFIGSALVRALRSRGDRVRPLVRPGGLADDAIQWDPERGRIDAEALEGIDGLVHLAGESIADGRWTEAHKARIRDSRVKGTSLLASTLLGLTRKPGVWISGSAIGIYGDRGAEELDEHSSVGHDFLSDVGVAWESAARPAAAVLRVVHPRTGVVLHPSGGALAKLLPVFKLGLGGKLGSGQQYMSWISLADTVRALIHALDRSDLRGPVNLTAPMPATNAEFTRELAAALGRPAFFAVPGFAARLAIGELAEVALLAGQRVLPKQLLGSAFRFEHPTLAECLRALLEG